MTRRTTFLGDVRRVARWVGMDELDQLPARMAAAAARLDYEEARRLRDLIALVRGGAAPDQAETADMSGIVRQRPGAIGLGTSRQRVTPPAGWTPPPTPDRMTRRHSKRR